MGLDRRRFMSGVVAARIALLPGESLLGSERFWARSPDESVLLFKVGGLDEGTIEFAIMFPWIGLASEWHVCTVDLTDRDLAGVCGALIWAVDPQHSRGPAELHLDDVYFTRITSGVIPRLKQRLPSRRGSQGVHWCRR